MPAQKRLGTNEERTPALFGKDPARRSEQRAVPVPVDRALDLPAQDLELVAKELDAERRRVNKVRICRHEATQRVETSTTS